MNRETMRADVIIPAYRPDERFFSLLSRLSRQSVVPEKIIIMNTERALWEAAGAEERLVELGISERCEIHHIAKAEFDHGGTRNAGVGFSNAPYFVMMTQDAVPENDRLIEALLIPLNQEIALSYGRQLPNRDADPIERFTRLYNYPAEDRIKGIGDLPALGIKTFFASNVCAAYERAAFERLGGFPPRAIFNEDMIYAARLLKAGGKIAYRAEAKVRHSHQYTAMQQFHRNFDLAVSQAEHPEIFAAVKSESEGIRMVRRTAGWLRKRGEARMLPRLFFLSAGKYLGYLCGRHYRALPGWMVKKCSMNRSYWQ